MVVARVRWRRESGDATGRTSDVTSFTIVTHQFGDCVGAGLCVSYVSIFTTSFIINVRNYTADGTPTITRQISHTCGHNNNSSNRLLW